MRRSSWASAAMLAVLLASFPAFAGYGAIAWDKGTGKWGVSWNQPTPKRAIEVAVSECGAGGCKVVAKIGAARCGALAATADSKHIGAAVRDGLDAARFAALKSCQADKAGECVIRTGDCNK
jgi:hypothetical protein